MHFSTRRDLLKGAMAGVLGVSFLSNSKALAVQSKSKVKKLIYLYMNGGMSHIDTFDPKPGTDAQGEYDPIKTGIPGVIIGPHLPNLAKYLDKSIIIRSMTSKDGNHQRGNYIQHTSYAPLGSVKHPSIASWILKLDGRANNNIPGAVMLNGNNRDIGDSGFLGSKYEPLRIGDPSSGLKEASFYKSITGQEFQERNSLLVKFNKIQKDNKNNNHIEAYNEYYNEALKTIYSEDVKAFDLSLESEETRNTYGKDRFGQGCLLARRLIEKDVRFVEVNLGGWDTHRDNFNSVAKRCQILDTAISALISDLKNKGLLDETLIVLATEFGRTPKINQNNGRDHYPKVFSSLLVGGGLSGSGVYGESNEKAAEVKDKPVTIQDLNATIAHAMGIEHDKKIISKDGRPFTMANEGKPIIELF